MLFDLIREWGVNRGLIGPNGKATVSKQIDKLQEEFKELVDALIESDNADVADAIGDMIVVLTLLADMRGLDVEFCIRQAYRVISKRTGKMVDGVFVKDGAE